MLRVRGVRQHVPNVREIVQIPQVVRENVEFVIQRVKDRVSAVALVLVIIHVPAVAQVAVMDHVVPVHIIAVVVQAVPAVPVAMAAPVVVGPVVITVLELVQETAVGNALHAMDVQTVADAMVLVA